MRLGLGKSLQTHPGLKAKILREPLRPYGAGLGQHVYFMGVQNYKKTGRRIIFFWQGPRLEFQMANGHAVVDQLF